MIGLKWILVAVGLVVLLAIHINIRWNQRTNLKQRQQKVETLATDPSLALETIFVTLPCYDVHACAHTIVSIFDKASCPGRIFVGVLHVLDKSRPESMLDLSKELERYIQELPATTGWPLIQEHLRFSTLASTECAGDGWVRAYMENVLYRGEKYYLSLQGQCDMTDEWDVLAIQQLKSCGSEFPVLVGCNKAGFLVAVSSDPMCMHLTQRTFLGSPSKPVPSLFCSSTFIFSLADRLVDTPSPDQYYYATMSELATDLSIRLWTSGWDFFSAPTPLCSSLIQIQACPSGYNGELLQHIRPGSFRSIIAYQEFCGVDCVQGSVSGRAKLGVTESPAALEIVSKYGSVTAFNYEKALVT